MISLFKTLPLELIINILSYDGSIKYRNGEFINKLSNKENITKILNNLPQIKIQFLNNKPWRYIKDLGEYYIYLYIDITHEKPRYITTISKKHIKSSPKFLYSC